MEALPNQLVTSAIFLLLFVCSSNAAATAPSQVIDDVCKSTYNPHVDYQVCLDILALNPASAKADLKTLGSITIQLGMNNFTGSANLADQLLKKATAPNMVDALKTCSQSYYDAKNIFYSAYRELDEDPLTANYDVDFAAYTVHSCDEAINSNKVNIPELVVCNNYAYIYSSIANIITERLERLSK